MAGLAKLPLRFFVASYLLVLAITVVVMPLAMASSFSTFWRHELPHASMPDSAKKLASPLSTSLTRQYLAHLKAGSLHASKNDEFCSSAGIYCPVKAVNPIQPRVCIPPFFFYEYAVLRCQRNGGNAASAVQSSSSIFFSQDSLAVGRVMHLPDTSNDLNGLRFLPHSLAKDLPELSENNMEGLAKFYGVTKGSTMELDMEDTLAHCSFKSKHEQRACHISGEGMVNFITKVVGHNAIAYAPPAVAMGEASVVDIAVLSSKGSRVASCHDMKFPSLLYSCHMTRTSQLMSVTLKLADGLSVIQLPAICHMDTSYWNPSHVAFQTLGVEPGKTSICHWLPQNSFIFVQGSN